MAQGLFVFDQKKIDTENRPRISRIRNSPMIHPVTWLILRHLAECRTRVSRSYSHVTTELPVRFGSNTLPGSDGPQTLESSYWRRDRRVPLHVDYAVREGHGPMPW